MCLVSFFACAFLKARLSFNPRFRVYFRTRAGKASLDANLFFEFRRILKSDIVDSIFEFQDFFGVNNRILIKSRHARHEIEACRFLSNKGDEAFVSEKNDPDIMHHMSLNINNWKPP